MPERAHLFRKHLSKHNLGAYRELCREVGRSFEATSLRNGIEAAASEPDDKSTRTDDSGQDFHKNTYRTSPRGSTFASTIAQLKSANASLEAVVAQQKDSLEQYRSEVTKLHTDILQTEDQVRSLKSTLYHRNCEQQQSQKIIQMYEFQRTPLQTSLRKFYTGLKSLEEDVAFMLDTHSGIEGVARESNNCMKASRYVEYAA